MRDTEPGKRLEDIIKKAIADCELTHSEHQEIVTIAHSDYVIDTRERELLVKLQELVADGTVRKVKD